MKTGADALVRTKRTTSPKRAARLRRLFVFLVVFLDDLFVALFIRIARPRALSFAALIVLVQHLFRFLPIDRRRDFLRLHQHLPEYLAWILTRRDQLRQRLDLLRRQNDLHELAIDRRFPALV